MVDMFEDVVLKGVKVGCLVVDVHELALGGVECHPSLGCPFLQLFEIFLWSHWNLICPYRRHSSAKRRTYDLMQLGMSLM